MLSTTVGQTDREAGREYRLEPVSFDQIDAVLLAEWEAFLERNPSPSPMHYPQWLGESFREQKHRLTVYFLFRAGSLAGLAPLLMKDRPIKWQLGEIALAHLPLRRLCLLGGGPHFPEDPAAYELLFRELPTLSFDAVYVEGAPVESFLWKFMEGNAAIRQGFSRYAPEAPAPRVLLRLEGSFEDYMGQFSSRHRGTLQRKVRKFQNMAPGEVQAVRCMRPEEVDSFVDQAVEISRKTYQWNLLGGGLSNTEEVRQRFSALARYGWLRSYLLVLKGQACAFVTGFQFGDRFWLDDMGYDPAWREYSVGTVLQLLLIEDLFSYNRPRVYELGEYGPHKEEFATDNYLQGKLFLFRRGWYTSFVRVGHQGCEASTKLVAGLLERLGLKKKIKKLLRMWSSKP